MRFHVLGMAHTHTTIEFGCCAYTQKIRNFCRMMMDRGHEVYLYGGEENDAPCTEHIVCVSEKMRRSVCNGHYLNVDHSPGAPHWVEFTGRAVFELSKRARKKDFLCVIFGMAQKPVADAMANVLLPVEYGIGYHETFAQHRVFESYAWMHTKYGAEKGSDRDGIWYDDVIPGYYDPSQFVLADKKSDFLFYMGRMIDRKGINVAVQIAAACGRRLIGAGPGVAPKGMHHVGELEPARRARMLSRAHAVLMPTLYIEPFGNVAIEAMASGTPVLTTDWGAFTETVKHGQTGFRCRTLQEFVDAVDLAGSLDPLTIQAYAYQNFSLGVIAEKYERYFRRLQGLWGPGWGALREPKGRPIDVD